MVPAIEVRVLTGELLFVRGIYMAKVKKKKNKPTRKDLKAPDDFQVKMAGFTPFLEQHGVKVIGLIVVLIVLLIGVYMFIRIAHTKNVDTSVAIQARINNVLEAEASKDKSRIETEVKALSTLNAKGKPYEIAVYIASGSALMAADKYREAAKEFKKTVALLDKTDPLYPFMQETLANCLVDAGKYKAAVDILDAAAPDASPVIQAQAHLLKGDIFNAQILPKTTLKSPEKAAKEYALTQKILKKDPVQTDYNTFLMHIVELRRFTVASGG